MKNRKIMLNLTLNELDSPLGESELLNLRIIASRSEFPVGCIVESVTALFKGNEDSLFESNNDLFDNADFNAGGDL